METITIFSKLVIITILNIVTVKIWMYLEKCQPTSATLVNAIFGVPSQIFASAWLFSTHETSEMIIMTLAILCSPIMLAVITIGLFGNALYQLTWDHYKVIGSVFAFFGVVWGIAYGTVELDEWSKRRDNRRGM